MAVNFESIKSIAVVGLSSNPERPSYEVAQYLQKNGFKIIPVNPGEQEILNEKSYPDLASIPGDIRVDAVDVFRKSDQVLPIVEQAIALKPLIIWLQEGVVNEEAKALSEQAGIEFVMNKCIKKEHQKLK